MPRWVEHSRQEEEVEEESSSEEEGSDGEQEEEGDDGDDADVGVVAEEEVTDERTQSGAGAATSGQRRKITIVLNKKDLVCHVCGKRGHCAGFVGAVYHDCPYKPCYLCKNTGHTTMTCPFRLAPEHGCTPSGASRAAPGSVLACVRQRERDGRKREVHMNQQSWLVDAAVLKLHSRRCTCLEFHPTKDNIVVSGDKKGQVAVWDFEKVHERTVYAGMHRALTNNLRFLGPLQDAQCASASSDGLLKVFDMETGFDTTLLNLNPEGWIDGVTTERSWKMLYGMDVCTQRQLIIAGDSHGCVRFVDARAQKLVAAVYLHKKGNKVTCADVNPTDCNLLLTCGNDWTARLCDIRAMSSSVGPSNGAGSGCKANEPMELASLGHPKVVNSAYFSPRTGSKILTTCIDNRLRVWDYLLSAGGPPDREIVHSHDFNRYLTPFRAEWDPTDHSERRVVVGRYISEDFGGMALHPVDIMDAATGRLLTQLVDANLATICPVNKPHPRLPLIVSGSSRSLYAWRPAKSDKEDAGMRVEIKPGAAAPTSSHFVSFDADNSATEKKKRKAASAGVAEFVVTTPDNWNKGKGKSKGQKGDADDSAAKKKGKKR